MAELLLSTKHLSRASLKLSKIPAETANQWTHGLGLALSLIGGVALVSTAATSGDWERIVGSAIYALTLIGLYAASTLSHSFSDPERRIYYLEFPRRCHGPGS